jgi:antitoxin HigA-1
LDNGVLQLDATQHGISAILNGKTAVCLPKRRTTSRCEIDWMLETVHPGRILKRELAARSLSANRLALSLRLPSGRITDILNGKRGISPDTALRLARFFGNSARFWLNIQTAFELAVAENESGLRILDEVRPADAAA